MAHHNIPAEPIGNNADGQHWTTVRELWMRKDKEQCEIWKDEVQNILIFSGLFSAIVTAFLIQSQADLQPDPAQQSVQLLKQIATQSAGKEWVAEDEQGVDPVDICVNVFWFLSLVLSLTTALVGIVSLQWIRSHIRSLSNGADSLGLAYMHSLGLHRSYIPLVFTSLPVILIFGLAFFLIGLILFLFKISWPVAIPVTFAIACTFAFLIITTLLPALQPFPVERRPSDNPKCYPSPYRSPQSRLFIPQRDWGFMSQQWLQQRAQVFFSAKKTVLSHLEPYPKVTRSVPKPFAYDTIKALVSVKESRSAESEKEKLALARCLAEVLPIHLNLFPTEDLADLLPFLPLSEWVPSAVFIREKLVARDDLSAVALLQAATCIGRPLQSSNLVKACIRSTRWLFERPHILNSIPDKQPLHLISKPAELSSDALENLIDILTRFFSFAADFRPDSQTIDKTTHTSSYTYWFLVLSAKILPNCSLSDEMLARHTYILSTIAVRLGDRKEGDYLFHTASIYAGKITASSAMQSSLFWPDFLRAVICYRNSLLENDPQSLRSPLCKALKANEVEWGNLDRALTALGPSGASTTHTVGANDINMSSCLPLLTRAKDLSLEEKRNFGGQTGDIVICMEGIVTDGS